MNSIIPLLNNIRGKLDGAGHWVGLLLIRVLLAYEFGSAGLRKASVEGGVPQWFVNTQGDFPFPFNVLPAGLNWYLVTYAELLGALALILGLFTRFWAFSLLIVSIVAIFGVHWPDEWNTLAELWQGYSVTNNGFGNYRIPLLFVAMLLPLIFIGPGKLSLDNLLRKHVFKS